MTLIVTITFACLFVLLFAIFGIKWEKGDRLEAHCAGVVGIMLLFIFTLNMHASGKGEPTHDIGWKELEAGTAYHTRATFTEESSGRVYAFIAPAGCKEERECSPTAYSLPEEPPEYFIKTSEGIYFKISREHAILREQGRKGLE